MTKLRKCIRIFVLQFCVVACNTHRRIDRLKCERVSTRVHQTRQVSNTVCIAAYIRSHKNTQDFMLCTIPFMGEMIIRTQTLNAYEMTSVICVLGDTHSKSKKIKLSCCVILRSCFYGVCLYACSDFFFHYKKKTNQTQKYAKTFENAIKCRKQFNNISKLSGKIHHAYTLMESKAPSEYNFSIRFDRIVFLSF